MSFAAMAASLAFVMGAGLVGLLWFSVDAGKIHSPQPRGERQFAERSVDYAAQLVRVTGCLWDPSSTRSRQIGAPLSSGESLDLLEGLAGVELTWTGGNANLSLEGPAGMILNAEGMPTLRFGKLTGAITAHGRPFELNTPYGRLVVAGYGSIGVSAFGNDADIHVFGGSATLETNWFATDSQPSEPVRLGAGEAIQIHAGPEGQLSIKRGDAEPAQFVAQMSMASDALVVPDEYVGAVKRSKPIGYWRLGREEWPRIPNEMGSRYACQVNGKIGVSGLPGNQALEFGLTNRGGDVLCTETFGDALKESYSLELWMKPSHYHVGALVSLVGKRDEQTGVIPHGLLLELGGSGHLPTAVHHPGRVRFLHRSPAGAETALGTSCYSKEPYTLRKWQHLVAVKEGDAMRLYVNGKLVGEAKDAKDLPSDLQLLIGRLYPKAPRSVRPFIGQLDELAVYDRALSPEEIAEHYELIRPKKADKKSI